MYIQDLQQTVVDDYFTRLNQSDFKGVAELFADSGCLYPPFEKKICGRAAIYRYLQAEAIDIEALPQSMTLTADRDERTIYQIAGKVKTSLFTVNISWTIELNTDRQIECITIKLLAELQELLGLDRSRSNTN